MCARVKGEGWWDVASAGLVRWGQSGSSARGVGAEIRAGEVGGGCIEIGVCVEGWTG